MDNLKTTCCITGGGPAGMMLGFLLARAGVSVIVLEKHADFLRDFRGDTVHPSTLEVIYELGLLDDFLSRPHEKMARGLIKFGQAEFPMADFSRLSTHSRFVAFMPQWDFLDFLVDNAKPYPTFRHIMQAQVTDLLEENGRVVGVTAKTPEGPLEVRADLVVGADGRNSLIREKAGLTVDSFGAPIDVLWMRISRKIQDPPLPLGHFLPGRVFVMFNRGEYYQCGLVIRKGKFEELKNRGLEKLRDDIAQSVPAVKDRVHELRDWKDMGLLTVRVDRLRQWYKKGFLCIGDAAHAMSPVGGIGINLAIQDAVAAANILAQPLKEGRLTIDDLRKVQRRREWPTKITQRLQIGLQNSLITNSLQGQNTTMPLAFRLLNRFPSLARFPAYVMGVGFRPEHVK